jgi:hypothetical protein
MSVAKDPYFGFFLWILFLFNKEKFTNWSRFHEIEENLCFIFQISLRKSIKRFSGTSNRSKKKATRGKV